MSSSSDDSNHHPWKRMAWRARENVSEALVALPDGYPRDRMLAVSGDHEWAQKVLFEYYSIFEPKADELGADVDDEEGEEESLWHEPLIAIEAPASGRVRAGQDSDALRRQAGSRELLAEIYADIPRRREVVSLATLRQWVLDSIIQLEVSGWVENQGLVSKTIEEPRYLPVSAMMVVRGQLDKCLDAGGWLPEWGDGKLPTIENFDQSGEEPSGGFGMAEHSGSPEL